MQKRLRSLQRKKAALELSVSTIIIIVLAMTLLILGMVLIRKIMCAGIILTDKISSATENEISNLFEYGEMGVKCMGESGSEVKLGGGGRRQVICVINTDTQGGYCMKYKTITSLDTSVYTTAEVEKWILDKGWKGSVNAGQHTITVGVLDLKRDVSNTPIKLEFDEYASADCTGSITKTHTLYIDVVPSGLFTSAIC